MAKPWPTFAPQKPRASPLGFQLSNDRLIFGPEWKAAVETPWYHLSYAVLSGAAPGLGSSRHCLLVLLRKFFVQLVGAGQLLAMGALEALFIPSELVFFKEHIAVASRAFVERPHSHDTHFLS